MKIQMVGQLTKDDANALIYMMMERCTCVVSTLANKVVEDGKQDKWSVNINVEHKPEMKAELNQLLTDFNQDESLTIYYRS